MKKIIVVLCLLLTSVFLTACGASNADSVQSLPTDEPLIVDLDLSGLSGTVVYSQVYNMMMEPEIYFGKVIKIAGYYSAYEDVSSGKVYHACIIPDAAACCAQGIEFVWKGEHTWPDDYPEDGTDILVSGILASYEEDGYTWLHLADAEVTWENE